MTLCLSGLSGNEQHGDAQGLGPHTHGHLFSSPSPLSLVAAFSPGAFLAGVPVQPVLLHYPNTLVGEVNWRGGEAVTGGWRHIC